MRKTLLASMFLTATLGVGFAYGQGSSALIAKADATNGKKVYTKYCVACHGKSGKGDGPAGKALKPSPRDFSVGSFKYSKNDKEMAAFIKKGKPPMPAWGKTLSDKEVNDIVAFVRSLKSER